MMMNKTTFAPYSMCGLLLVKSIATPDSKAAFDETD